MTTFHETLKAARERRGLKQRDCAQGLKIAQSTWCDWESGKMKPRPDRVDAIAGLLGLSAKKLKRQLISELFA